MLHASIGTATRGEGTPNRSLGEVLAEDGAADGVRGDGRSAEALQAVVVDEAAVLQALAGLPHSVCVRLHVA